MQNDCAAVYFSLQHIINAVLLNVCVHAQLTVRVNILGKLMETFQLHKKFLSIQSVKNGIVHNLGSTGVVN